MNDCRYKVVPDAPSGGYRIFDTARERFLNNQSDSAGGEECPRATGNFTLWKKITAADDWANKLNTCLEEETLIDQAARSESAEEKEAVEEEKDEVVARWAENSERAAKKTEHQYKMDRWQTIILTQLEGKVCCSGCSKGFYGNDDSRHGDGKTMLKVTRYLGADNPESQLMVDLECTWCGHGGMYQFENNPIFNLDIPF